MGIDPTEGPDPVEVVKAQRERNKTLVEMAEASAFFYRDFHQYDEKAAKKNLMPDAIEGLSMLRQNLGALRPWVRESIHDLIAATADALDVKMGGIAQPLRVAVSGTSVSPPIDLTLEILGQEKTMLRIDQALAWIKKG
jgi:glutamyl-tRNA synthetase